MKRQRYPRPGTVYCYFEVRGNNKMLCRICNEHMRVGDPCVMLWGSNMHRICIKQVIEWTLDLLPLTNIEIATDPTGLLAEVEYGRIQREFNAYRDELLEKLQCED